MRPGVVPAGHSKFEPHSPIGLECSSFNTTRRQRIIMICTLCEGRTPDRYMWDCKTCRDAGYEDCELLETCVWESCPRCDGTGIQ